MSVKLHDYWRSSASYRVRIALNLKGVAHERRDLSLIENEQRIQQGLRNMRRGLTKLG